MLIRTPNRTSAAILAVALLITGVCRADVRLPAVISDNMVLQRETPATVWGWADPGAEIVVEFAGQRQTAAADATGKWRLRLDPLPASAVPQDMTISATDPEPPAQGQGAEPKSVKLTNILVGEVWVCSGQSNMQMNVGAASTAAAALADADKPGIRLFKLARIPTAKPAEDVKAAWQICASATAKGFSAAGYFFGRELHKDLDVPVGLIQNAWGGTPIQAFISLPALEAEPQLQSVARVFKAKLEKFPDLRDNFHEHFLEWDKGIRVYRRARNEHAAEAKKAKAEGRTAPPPPKYPGHLPASKNLPSVLYNGMVAPLTPFAIRGAIWYQGEADAGRAYLYRTLLPEMIKCWRGAWAQGDFPFLFVQLPNFKAPASEPGESSWAELREAQLMTLATPNTGMAVTIDIGEAKDIHPRNKEDVGKRLALCALGAVYGRQIVHSGPVYEAMTVRDGRIELAFRHVGAGLVARDGGPLKHFAVAGAERKFVWAEARIEGSKVLVWSDKVPDPVAARYAWADNPEGCNLYNAEGLPASPFRTDDWPGLTAPKK